MDAELRLQDFALEDYQEMISDSFRDFFEKECPSSLVRETEAAGYAPGLWKQLVGMGAVSMGLPAEVGGDGSSLVDLTLVAEEAGSVMAPVPLIAHVVASRLLARAGAARELLTDALAGDRIFTLAPVRGGARQLVPEASISGDVIALDGGELVLFSGSPSAYVPNQGGTAAGWWESPGKSRTVLASGAQSDSEYARAVAEWKVLTAAALIGLTDRSMWIGVEFTKTRRTMGVPIGALQGVAFPLVDVAIGVTGGRNLVRKAAWMLENDPDARPGLPLIAFAYAREVAGRGVSIAAHAQGGMGVAREADATMYFVRGKAWAALAGNAADDYVTIAEAYAAEFSSQPHVLSS
jgi:alkylation response protein AidB-like acyl-CoA dehydrogenase